MSIALGLDFGTSSLKCLLVGAGAPQIVTSPYREQGPRGMITALADSLKELKVPLHKIESVGLSGQTGTYCVTSRDLNITHLWLPWHEPGREAALARALEQFDPARFIAYIGMAHPRLASYPLPTLLWLGERYPELTQSRDILILQPKDYMCGLLTGGCLSDRGSWRGLARAMDYSPELLDYAGIDAQKLPVLAEWGQVDRRGAELTGFSQGTPVAVGQNDFYSALTGMGLSGPGDCFDVTGTSEHLGVITGSLCRSQLIASPYRDSYAHYGVTASSGRSLDFARKNFMADEPSIPRRAPLFLPYLAGERAPVFDSGARGLMVGLTDASDREIMAYSVMEGVVFSLYDIYQALGEPLIHSIRATGGASASRLLGRLKASLFGVPYLCEELTCGSAMGAAKLAGGIWERRERAYEPEAELTDFMRARFEGYRRLYGAWRHIAEGLDTGSFFG